MAGTGSVVGVHRLNCPGACGIFLDQGWNLCLLHWKANSHLLTSREVPVSFSIRRILGFQYPQGCWSQSPTDIEGDSLSTIRKPQ